MRQIKKELLEQKTSSSFSLLLWNVRSIKTLDRFTKFKVHLAGLVSNKKNIIDCLIITESWINENDTFKMHELKNYDSFQVSRKSSGGGIIIYVNKTYVCNIVSKTCTPDVEAILLCVTSYPVNKKILALYRPPSGNLENFCSFVDDVMTSNDDLIVAGDMNINVLMQQKFKHYDDLLMMNGYRVVNTGVTRENSGTLLDHILLKRDCESVKICTSKQFKLSDHNMVVMFMSNFSSQSEWKHKEMSRTNYKVLKEKIDQKNLYEMIETCPNVSQAVEKVITSVRTALIESSTTVKIKQKSKTEIPPYVDWKYLNITRKMNNLFDKIRKLERHNKPTSALREKLNNFNSVLESHTQLIAKQYYTRLIKDNRSFSWKIINEITGKQKDDKKYLMEISGQVHSDKRVIVDAFQTKFSSVVSGAPNEVKFRYLGKVLENSLVFSAVDEKDVEIQIKELSSKKAIGSDGIPVKVWKENISLFVPLITNFINEMLVTGCYPDILKIAAIIPIHKGGSKTSIDNYRGISLLPVINKVIEKILYEKISRFITKYRMFDELQFGYRKFHGTQDAICKVLSIISEALDRKKYVTVVFFDIAKAFDSINHQQLLYKIQRMGIRGVPLEILRDYLTNRQQFVKIDDQKSECSLIRNGVPQGSNLGPLLFSMMLYDLKFVGTEATIVKFADDIVMISVGDDFSDIAEPVMKDIKRLKNYYDNNGLKINLNKSKYMTFGYKVHPELEEFMDLNNVEKVSSMRYLGVCLDDQLKLKEQTDVLMHKLSTSLNAMTIIKHHLPAELLIQFYNAYISSHLFYSGFVLCRLSMVDINRLQRIQNKALKIVYGLDKRFSTIELFTKVAVNVLPVVGIAYYNLLLLVKKNLLAKDDADRIFDVIKEGRRSQQIKFDRFHKNVLARDFVCLGPMLYNQLPLEMRELEKYNAFKRNLRTYLLDKKEILLRGNQLIVNKLS